jgi:hypothetical protein
MPLTNLTLSNTLSWQLAKAVTGFASVQQGADKISADLQGVQVATFNQLYANQFSLAASGGSTTIDLSTFTNLVGESTGLGHALTIMVTVSGTGANVAVAPGASNGLVWFFSGTTPAVNLGPGCSFCFSGPAAGPGQVVDSTHKNMTLTNNGSGTATVKIVVLGSTT